MVEKKILVLLSGTVSFAALLFAVNFLYFREVPNLFALLNVLAVAVGIMPVVIVRYSSYRKKKDYEDLFPVFLRDFIEAVRGGRTVPAAFQSVSKNDYKSLTPLIARLSAQLEWGIPVDKALMNFSKSVKSPVISRIISSVIESNRFGGRLTDTFEALANTAVEVDRLRSERRLYLQSQMITGYIIFFVFLAVIIGLQKFLIPSFSQAGNVNLGAAGGAPSIPPEVIAAEYKDIFRNLILMQGLFAGLSVGKMAEGAVIAGVKHSLFMLLVGVFVFSIFGCEKTICI